MQPESSDRASGAAVVRSEFAAEQLRSEVLAGGIAPGAAVTEASVAVRFSVARPTARTAIERLVADGLLERQPHHAARVPVLSRADIADIYDARAVVESAALAALAALGAVPPAAVAANRALATADADAGFARDDIAFHRALVDAQPNRRLARLHRTLMGEIELCIGQVHAHRLLSPAQIAREHQGVLTAVVAGDSDAAARQVEAHIRHSRDRILAHHDSIR